MTEIEALFCQAGIPYSTPTSADFDALLSNFSGNHLDGKPSLITTPETEQHVAAIVSACVANRVKFVVRGGGHDAFGRSTVANGVTIDLRKLSSVAVSQDRQTARIGGGATSVQVLTALAPKGCRRPSGHQIVGARVVTADGTVVDADGDMLKGLRGGGSNLGVVVELTVKVYPFENIQAGMLMFESSDIEKTLTTFLPKYAELFVQGGTLPRKFYTMPVVITPPGMSTTLCCFVVYNGPASDESQALTERIGSLAPLMPGTPPPDVAVATTSALEFARRLMDMFPKQLQGRSQTASVTHFSPDVVGCLARGMGKKPSTSNGGIIVQQMRSDCPSCGPDVPESVCPYRKPHITFEILGTGPDDEAAEAAMAWALETRNELMGLPDAVKSTYIATTSPECLNVADIFGDKLEELRRLKQRYDPKGSSRTRFPGWRTRVVVAL
ncbi:hypothetical protein ACCO45_009713 [Purpureocillium lilacinum]|uniref:Uncharacterized protein n=1 Tax=Purpureocillium lilacinum TaxID=33203 RepID=A0ACC4DM01_PURLI